MSAGPNRKILELAREGDELRRRARELVRRERDARRERLFFLAGDLRRERRELDRRAALLREEEGRQLGYDAPSEECSGEYTPPVGSLRSFDHLCATLNEEPSARPSAGGAVGPASHKHKLTPARV